MFGKKINQPDLEAFTIFDSKSQSYRPPMFAANRHVFVREITNCFRDPQEQAKNQLFVNAEDFAIFKVGSFDVGLGKLVTHEAEHVANLHDLRSMVLADRMALPANGQGAL